jgi:hypothetical protein
VAEVHPLSRNHDRDPFDCGSEALNLFLIAINLYRLSQNVPWHSSSLFASRASGSFNAFMNQPRLAKRVRRITTRCSSFACCSIHACATSISSPVADWGG